MREPDIVVEQATPKASNGVEPPYFLSFASGLIPYVVVLQEARHHGLDTLLDGWPIEISVEQCLETLVMYVNLSLRKIFRKLNEITRIDRGR